MKSFMGADVVIFFFFNSLIIISLDSTPVAQLWTYCYSSLSNGWRTSPSNSKEHLSRLTLGIWHYLASTMLEKLSACRKQDPPPLLDPSILNPNPGFLTSTTRAVNTLLDLLFLANGGWSTPVQWLGHSLVLFLRKKPPWCSGKHTPSFAEVAAMCRAKLYLLIGRQQ